MARWPVLLSSLLFASGLAAQATGVSREYLAETVRRGLPVLSASVESATVPYWPRLEARLHSEKSTRPSQDLGLVEGWMLLHQERIKEASFALTGVWAEGNGVSTATPVVRAEAWFSVLSRLGLDEELMKSWQVWDQKSLSATALSLVLPSLAAAHPTAVTNIVRQAFSLYPEDHRWLPWMLENLGDFPQIVNLVRRDRLRGPGLTSDELGSLLRRKPNVRASLVSAGYTVAELDAALSQDYAAFVGKSPTSVPASGVWRWDQDRDGRFDHRIVFDQSRLLSWSRGGLDPQSQSWTLAFTGGRPLSLVETHRDAFWTLDWEDYPWVSTLTYRYGTHQIEYHFPAYTVSVPLGERPIPADQEALWPWLWDQDGSTLSLPTLVTQAASVVMRDRDQWTKTLSLVGGQVWMSVESSKGDGKADQWSFYRAGKLDRVYRGPQPSPSPTLQELYAAGEYQAFLAAPSGTGRTEFALFPAEGVQLWDPEGSGTPLIRWVGGEGEGIRVMAFRGETLPWGSKTTWATMPPWDPLP